MYDLRYIVFLPYYPWCFLVHPAPGLRPGYPGPIHGPGPGSDGVRVRVQKRRQKRRILSQILAQKCPIFGPF